MFDVLSVHHLLVLAEIFVLAHMLWWPFAYLSRSSAVFKSARNECESWFMLALKSDLRIGSAD